MRFAYEQCALGDLSNLATLISTLFYAIKFVCVCVLQAILKAFSRDALEHYIPVIQEEVRSALTDWLERAAPVLVYPEMKRLMFRIAMRILLGFEPEQIKRDEQELVEAFEEMIKNLFSLPIDVPFSGLYRVNK